MYNNTPLPYAGIVHSISGWMQGVQAKLWNPLKRMPYLSALEVCSWQGTIQIHVYLYLYICHRCVNLFQQRTRRISARSSIHIHRSAAGADASFHRVWLRDWVGSKMPWIPAAVFIALLYYLLTYALWLPLDQTTVFIFSTNYVVNRAQPPTCSSLKITNCQLWSPCLWNQSQKLKGTK